MGDEHRPVVLEALGSIAQDQGDGQQAEQVPPLEGMEEVPQQAV